MISRDLQAQRQELHHPVFIQLHKLTILSREHERRRVPEVYKAEIAVWMYFAVKHGRDLTRILFLTYLERVAGCDRQRQAKIDVFKQLRRRSSVLIEFREHEGMESVVYGGGDLRR